MKARGFTLVEMVLTMVIGSILILGIAGFVELGSRGYADTVDRQRIQTQARFVLEKMTREIRHAVPNSFNAENNCISFYPVVNSGFYSLTEDGAIYTLSLLVGQDDYYWNGAKMVVNPSRPEDLESGLTLDSNQPVIEFSYNPFASQSIAQRFFTYKEKVEYCLVATSQNTGIYRKRIDFEGSDVEKMQVADSINISESEFSYKAPNLQRGGVVHLSLVFEQNGEESHFETDVQVLNVP